MRNKFGQITIFVIMGILITVGIAIYFVFSSSVSTSPKPGIDIKSYIRSCIQDSVESELYKYLETSIVRFPLKSIRYHGRNYTFLCYSSEPLKKCLIYYPDLESKIESELQSTTFTKVRDCFWSFISEIKDQGFNVSASFSSYSVDILPKKILVNINSSFSVSRGDSSSSFNNIEIGILSPAYELIDLSLKIASSEALFCDFEYGSYMLLHPEINIGRFSYKANKLYELTDERTLRSLRFATRSCVLPV